MKSRECSEEEYSMLLPAPHCEASPPRVRFFPVLAAGFCSLGYALTLASHCTIDSPATCLPDLQQIPFIRPYIYQSCVFLGCVCAAVTLLVFSSAIDAKTVSVCFWKYFSLLSGLCSLFVLAAFSLTASETRDFPPPSLRLQASILLFAYFLLVTMHCLASTHLHSLLSQYEVVSRPSPWQSTRIWTARVISALTIALFLCKCLPETSQLLQKYAETIFNPTSHCLFLLSFFHIATYQHELGSVEVSVTRRRPDALFKEINRVTLCSVSESFPA